MIVFDSTSLEKESQRLKSSLMDLELSPFHRSSSQTHEMGTSLMGDRELEDQMRPQFLSKDAIQARSAFLLNFSLQAVITRNPE